METTDDEWTDRTIPDQNRDMSPSASIPVIDLFAGPGGLGEGFASYTRGGRSPFQVSLSIEKDAAAHETLLLRCFFRQFDPDSIPEDYYRALRGEITQFELFERHPAAANAATAVAWRATLGAEQHLTVRRRVEAAIGKSDPWVLIGGPPCQAYSLIGRSRNKGVEKYDPANDEKQTLYVEYLQIIADHWPAVFVMENVKGLLSATLNDQRVFQRILDDLRSPRNALRREGRSIRRNGGAHEYQVFSVVRHGMFEDSNLADFVVRTEDHGIPQARHRIILLGVRDDHAREQPGVLPRVEAVPAEAVLDGLPRLRSGRSKGTDTADDWIDTLRAVRRSPWLRRSTDESVRSQIEAALDSLTRPRQDRGGEHVPGEVDSGLAHKWYVDPRIGGACNHATRGHMDSDLHRYLFAACFARVHGRSPVLRDFPASLWPSHTNIVHALNGHGMFADRFRVQTRGRPSTTITAHIAKDGHYYIHYDPSQCRSLTVREAARLQTFPDNYFFCGNRTAQYAQVGNAVPPLLARQIAGIVADLLGE